MGLAERNYYRNCNGGWGDGPSGWPQVCRSIVFINIGVFIAQVLLVQHDPVESVMAELAQSEDEFVESWLETNRPELAHQNDSVDEYLRDQARFEYQQLVMDSVYAARRPVSVVQNWCQLETDKVMHGQVWRLVTCAFCHDRDSLLHILFNMLGLIWFGIALEQMYGSREFVWFYLTAAVISSLTYVALDLYTGQEVPAIGASGAVMAVLMLYACHFSTATIRIWFFFPIQIRWLVLLYVAYYLHPVLMQLSGDPYYTGVAHAAHLGGLAFGYVYFRQRLRLWPVADRISRMRWKTLFRRNTGLSVYAPDGYDGGTQDVVPFQCQPGPADALDRVLDKISCEGRDSLTGDDLAILEEESRRLRGRSN